jgi:hypothetical protein
MLGSIREIVDFRQAWAEWHRAVPGAWISFNHVKAIATAPPQQGWSNKQWEL